MAPGLPAGLLLPFWRELALTGAAGGQTGCSAARHAWEAEQQAAAHRTSEGKPQPP